MSSSSTSELSECSGSPLSYTNGESPNSSPSHQVPQLTNNLTGLTCDEKSFHFLRNVTNPSLVVVEQPQNHFRFRYVSEMVGTHGCLLGSTTSHKLKTHPTVELMNYSGRALIRCRLAQCDNTDEHPHKLLEEEQEDIDLCSEVPLGNSYRVSFAGMGIIHTAKKDVPGLIFKKFSEQLVGTQYNTKELRLQCDNVAKKINLNIVRLRFSAHDIDTGKEICEAAFSEPIHNMKSAATNDLKICRISQYTGRPRGGDDVFILVEKVNKKNIMVKFTELNEYGKEVWSENGSFLQSDVHHQYAIVFRTPAYRDPRTPVDVKVVIELVRPSDGRRSEPKHFTYKAEQVYKQIKKRKNNSSFSSLDSSSGGSITNEIPTTVFNCPMEINDTARLDTEIPLITMQLPQTSQSPNHCGLGSALGTLVHEALAPSPQAFTGPMWGSSPPQTEPCAIVNTSIPDLRLQSTELEELISRNANMTADDRTDDLAGAFGEYVDSFNSLSDLPTEKKEPSSPETPPPDAPAGRAHKHKESDYDAYYEPEDGLEVKKLVQELCEIIKNKKGHKNHEVRAKLERLFEIRLSNGDTFLHMTLCSNTPSFESIVRVIHSVKMSHLLNCGNFKHLTILHLAVLNGSLALIPLLLSKGCDPMLKNSEEDNVIQYAVRYKTSSLEPLLEAIKKNNVPCDLNACNSEKQTALHLAALNDCSVSATALLKYGASPNVRDAAGRTPLHLAAYDARAGVMRALLQHMPPSDVDVLDGRGNTALQIVCGRAMCPTTLEMVQLLLDKTADPGKHEEHNESAWRMSRHEPAIRELLKQHVSLDSALEDDVKSEPEDEFESADEDMSETGMVGLSQYGREVALRLDATGAWRDLALRLRTDALLNWYASQPSPTYTLLNHVKECRDDVTSKSLALMLEDMGQTEAANTVRKYLE